MVWAVAVSSIQEQADPGAGRAGDQRLHSVGQLPLLMLGGFNVPEGVEKLAHKWLHNRKMRPRTVPRAAALADQQVDGGLEAEKIGAIRTDFVLSAEIIVIALGTVADKPLMSQIDPFWLASGRS